MSNTMTPERAIEILKEIKCDIENKCCSSIDLGNVEAIETAISIIQNSLTSKPLYKFHYSSIILDRWKNSDSDTCKIFDVTVYADNLKNAEEKCLDLIRYKLVKDCGYQFQTNIESICEVMKP